MLNLTVIPIADVVPYKFYKLNYPHWKYYVFMPIRKNEYNIYCYVCCRASKQRMLKDNITFHSGTLVIETDLSEFNWAEEFKLFCL